MDETTPYTYLIYAMTAGFTISGCLHFITFALLPARFIEWIDV